MRNNGVETRGIRKAKDRGYDVFDRLPRAYKEMLWYASTPIHAIRVDRLAPVHVWQKTIEEALHKSCLATYGPDHPQAFAPKIRDICLEDLDL